MASLASILAQTVFGGITDSNYWKTVNYGWVCPTNMTLTNDTIYVNTNKQMISIEDAVELVLGTYERCLVTLYQTNPIAYRVAPWTNIQTFFELSYTSNSVTTNSAIKTNAFGWYIEQNLLTNLDAKIKALVPYYVDTNTVYDGSTNIVMLTVTGLWDSLKIGDGTNQFTIVPPWTNITTNWLVNYTNYYPFTNGSTTNIIYTTAFYQAVSYATNWDGTNWGWGTISNWPNIIVTSIQTTVYGTLGTNWHFYTDAFKERFKVLNALKITTNTITWDNLISQHGYSDGLTNRDAAIAAAWADRTNHFSIGAVPGEHFQIYDKGGGNWDADCDFFQGQLYTNGLNTNIACNLSFYLYTTSQITSPTHVYEAFDSGYSLGLNTITNPYICPPVEWVEDWPTAPVQFWGYWAVDEKSYFLADWQFLYCTNKYW